MEISKQAARKIKKSTVYTNGSVTKAKQGAGVPASYVPQSQFRWAQTNSNVSAGSPTQFGNGTALLYDIAIDPMSGLVTMTLGSQQVNVWNYYPAALGTQTRIKIVWRGFWDIDGATCLANT